MGKRGPPASRSTTDWRPEALRCPVGGGAVNDAGAVVFNQAHRLHGGGVRQAEEHQVGGVEKLLSLRHVLAFILVET